jgi:hypothetical protein
MGADMVACQRNHRSADHAPLGCGCATLAMRRSRQPSQHVDNPGVKGVVAAEATNRVSDWRSRPRQQRWCTRHRRNRWPHLQFP